jgi:integrase
LRNIKHLTGVEQKTTDEYTRYVTRDIAPVIGHIPRKDLGEEDIAICVQALEEQGSAPKTIANKHGFLSGALAAAVPKHLPANPAAGRRLPRGTGDDYEMLCLTRDQFAHLHAAVTEPWQPMVEFLVASGARIGEVLALKPSDVDQAGAEVRIRRALKRSTNGYTIGPPKTKRSRREINVPATVLEKLDYSKEWLFTNPGSGAGGPSTRRRGAGGPVRAVNFRANVWWPAVERAWPSVDANSDPIPNPLRPRVHDLRHLDAAGRSAHSGCVAAPRPRIHPGHRRRLRAHRPHQRQGSRGRDQRNAVLGRLFRLGNVRRRR